MFSLRLPYSLCWVSVLCSLPLKKEDQPNFQWGGKTLERWWGQMPLPFFSPQPYIKPWLLRSVQNSLHGNGASTLFTWHKESNDVPVPWLNCFRFLGFSSSSSSLELSLEVWRQNFTGSTFTKVKGESIKLMKTSYYISCMLNKCELRLAIQLLNWFKA